MQTFVGKKEWKQMHLWKFSLWTLLFDNGCLGAPFKGWENNLQAFRRIINLSVWKLTQLVWATEYSELMKSRPTGVQFLSSTITDRMKYTYF